ncbi:MAG TPA: GNAT family N-acetyltransferase [Ktedonobacteraceae bacterium]|nr:GNAT family N-acetyltransferase [Ktedonobacteraceae bacterium]
MALGTWWTGDSLPNLPQLPAFSSGISTDLAFITSFTRLSARQVEARWHDGHHFYQAFLDETPVAYGWVATERGGVEEIQLAFRLPPRNRYLWDFQTLPPWRGLGIYPQFLQAILRAEQHLADCFWILYEPGNDVAARSISKAGFVFLGELVLVEERVSSIQLFQDDERAHIGAALLDLPIAQMEEP